MEPLSQYLNVVAVMEFMGVQLPLTLQQLRFVVSFWYFSCTYLYLFDDMYIGNSNIWTIKIVADTFGLVVSRQGVNHLWQLWWSRRYVTTYFNFQLKQCLSGSPFWATSLNLLRKILLAFKASSSNTSWRHVNRFIYLTICDYVISIPLNKNDFKNPKCDWN